MTLGDLKKESLKLMFVKYDSDITDTDLSVLGENENYATCLASIPGAVNRAFSDIELKKVIPQKGFVINGETTAVTASGWSRYDLETLIPDFLFMGRIIRRDASGRYDPNSEYMMEGKTLVLRSLEKDEAITVLYLPKIDRVTSETSNDIVIELPEFIATAIPYYVKSDLFREEEPREASEARNLYEAAMAQITEAHDSTQTRVHNVFDFSEV